MSESCATRSSKVVNEAVKETVKESKREEIKATQLQTLFAEKAFKFLSENNPAVLHKFTADPCVLVYDDTVYVYGTNDSQQAEFTQGKQDNGYNKITTLNCFSSKDLVNWTDCGEIEVAGKNGNGAAKWAANSWAPAICTKKIDGKDKFFLYFADSGNGIGVLTSDNPTGPFIDPLGKALVSRQTPNTAGVHWMFDPAVLVDDDGKGYLYFGGGTGGVTVHPKSARVVALNDDMISLAGTPVEIDAPYLFEDSGINKINGKYYYSYCTNWDNRAPFKDSGEEVLPVAYIAYMISDSPLGPFKYAGASLKNPGEYFGAYGNNHHWLFQFKNKWYMAYHAQIIEKQLQFEKGGYRSLVINDFVINADGTWPVQNMKKDGVAPVCSFNPYEEISAATMHSSKNMIVTGDRTLYPLKDGGYICIKGADLSRADGRHFVLKAGEKHCNGKITVRVDNFSNGDVISEIELNDAAQAESIITLPEGENERNLFITFTGDVELVSWEIK